MNKRLIAITLCLVLVTGCVFSAQAGVTSLDKALSRWLADQTSVRFSATLQLKTLMPFSDDTISMLNGVLKHTTVRATIDQNGEDNTTALEIAMDGNTLMSLAETLQSGAYTVETSLLPNRTLTSVKTSPMDLLNASETETVPTTTVSADTVTATAAGADAAITDAVSTDNGKPKDKTVSIANDSDIASAFSLLDAVSELQDHYQALTDGITAFATEKNANYNIKGIGAGKWSRIARLTPEQSTGLLNELRAVLSSGMDAAYREEISQATFENGFVVALYQNADKQDICLYLKGNLTDTEGTKRKLVWQWAFTTNGLKRKDVFTYSYSKLDGAPDTRIVEANCTQESRSDLFSISGKTETTLKRAKIMDKSTVKINLSGEKTDTSALTCKGDVNQELAQTIGGETTKSTESTAVDLLFTPDADGSVLSGTINYQKRSNKTILTEIDITLDKDAAQEAVTSQSSAPKLGSNGVTVDIVSQNGATVAPEETPANNGAGQVSSIEQIGGDFAEEPAATSASEGSTDYLVGAAPIGLKTFTTPASMENIDMDHAGADKIDSLLTEAAQNFAGKLILAIAALPEEDAALLKDGMTDEDYAAFLSIINSL